MKRENHLQRGFTLIEVMTALGILVLLAGALFSTVRATLEATAFLQRTQQFRQQVFGFFTLCEQTFRALPASAIIVFGNREEKGKGLPEIILRQAPSAFVWGEVNSFNGEISLSTHLEASGTITLGVEQREIDPLTGQPKPNPPWLPLLSQLKKVSWRFFDDRNAQWQEFWTDTNQHPRLLELTLQFEGETELWTHTFWLPPLVPALNGGGANPP